MYEYISLIVSAGIENIQYLTIVPGSKPVNDS
jgi:hypothetical protein